MHFYRTLNNSTYSAIEKESASFIQKRIELRFINI